MGCSVPARRARSCLFSSTRRRLSMACCTLLRTAWRLSGLVRKSYAPSFIAATAASTVPYAVIRTTSASGATARTARSSSCPLMDGIIRSVSTTSTACARRVSTASSPLRARRMRYPSRAKIRSSESRFACSSSTTRMVPRLSTRRLYQRLPFEERDDELVRVELLEVRHLLAHAHVPDRDLERVADADDHAALGRPVQLGEDESGDAERLVELPRLLDRVLAGGRVDDQQHLVRRALLRLGESALQTLQLLHEICLGVQTRSEEHTSELQSPFHL